MFFCKASVLVALLATTSVAAVAGVRSRQAAESSSSFKLFAYSGDDIGGYEIFYADGLAYVGDSSALTTATEVTAVNLTASSAGVWTATPAGNVSWTSKTFYVANATGQIGFADNSNSSSEITTSGFRFYGNFALLAVDDHLEASWNAEATDVQNVWTLGWGVVPEQGSLTSVMLRNAAPVVTPEDTTTAT